MGKLSRCSSRPSSDRQYCHESACRPRQSVLRPAHSLLCVRIRDGHSGCCCSWSVAFFAECTAKHIERLSSSMQACRVLAAAGSVSPKPPSAAAPSRLPTSPAVRLLFSFCLLLILCAWVSARDLSPLPIALSARGSSACGPKLTQCASLSCRNSRRPTCQELQEPRLRA